MKKTAVSLAFLLVLSIALVGCSKSPESITADGELTLDVGNTVTLTWEVLPEDATDQAVAFDCSDEATATVDDLGTVTGIAPGRAAITIKTTNGLEATVAIAVLQPVEQVECESDLTLQIGETAPMDAKVLPENASDATLTYSSSDESVATVDKSGTITAVAAGTSVIRAESINGVIGQTFVKVEIPVSEIQFDHTELYLYINGSFSLTATVLPEDAAETVITWASSDTGIATVDDTGTVSAHELGSATITATAENGVSATCNIVVTQPNNSGGGGGGNSGGTAGGSGNQGGQSGQSGTGSPSGDSGGGGGGPQPTELTDTQIQQAIDEAAGYARGLGFSVVGSAQPGHSVASTAYSDYAAFLQNLKDNVSYVASLFEGDDLSLVNVCFVRDGRSVYVTYG